METLSCARTSTLNRLRAMIGQAERPRSHEAFRFSLYEGGIPKGALSEITGVDGGGKTQAVLKFLSEHPRVPVAWIEGDFSVYPRAFPSNGVSLSRVLFIDASRDVLWATLQILRSSLFGVIIVSNFQEKCLLTLTDLRRLQLASEKAHASLILLTKKSLGINTWPLSFQFQVKRDFRNLLITRVLKDRNRQMNQEKGVDISWNQKVS